MKLSIKRTLLPILILLGVTIYLILVSAGIVHGFNWLVSNLNRFGIHEVLMIAVILMSLSFFVAILARKKQGTE